MRSGSSHGWVTDMGCENRGPLGGRLRSRRRREDARRFLATWYLPEPPALVTLDLGGQVLHLLPIRPFRDAIEIVDVLDKVP